MNKLLFMLATSILALNTLKAQDCINMADFITEIESYNSAISIDITEGWNIIGYPCQEEMAVIAAFSPLEENLIIVKNGLGEAYLPEWGFDGIVQLIPGQGYQIKVTTAYFDFQFCESNILYPNWTGCTDCEADNFSFTAIIDDGSCEYDEVEIAGCTD
jgi:hypothetical protein